PVEEGLRMEPGEHADHLDSRPRAPRVLERLRDCLTPRAETARGEVTAASEPPGAGERELVAERLELDDRFLHERHALLHRGASGEGPDETGLAAGGEA